MPSERIIFYIVDCFLLYFDLAFLAVSCGFNSDRNRCQLDELELASEEITREPHLYIQRRIHRYRISRGLPTVIGDVIIIVGDHEDPDGRDNARKLLEEGLQNVGLRKEDGLT